LRPAVEARGYHSILLQWSVALSGLPASLYCMVFWGILVLKVAGDWCQIRRGECQTDDTDWVLSKDGSMLCTRCGVLGVRNWDVACTRCKREEGLDVKL
jgi:hypothetical protein